VDALDLQRKERRNTLMNNIEQGFEGLAWGIFARMEGKMIKTFE
jgi:hypothetical protein